MSHRAPPCDSPASCPSALDGIDLPELSRRTQRLTLLAIGFDSGEGFLARWDCWRRQAGSGATLDYLAIETDPLGSEQALADRVPPELRAELDAGWPSPEPGLHRLEFAQGRVRLLLWFGEVLDGLAQFDALVDAAWVDSWRSSAVARQLFRLLRPGGRLACATWSASLESDLAAGGFEAGHQPTGLLARRPERSGIVAAPVPIPVGPVAVVGAGVAGLAVAEALCRAGIEVELFDPAGWSLSGASGNPGALIHVESAGALPYAVHNQAVRLALSRFAALQASGMDCGYVAGGVVRGSGPGSVTLRGGWVNPARLRDALLASAGPRLRLRELTVREIRRDGTRWRLNDSDDYSAVVLACGMDAGRLWPRLLQPLRAVGGQVELLRGDFSALRTARIGERWLLPLDAGHALAGASFVPDQSTPVVDPEISALTLSVVREQWPELDFEHLGSRVGVRVVSPDRRPQAGPLPAHGGGWQRDGWPLAEPGLWGSLAHGSRGFASAFLAAECIVSGLTGRVPALPRDLRQAVDPRRFLRR